MKIAFIGGGNMATAIVAALLTKGICRQNDITVSDIAEERRSYLSSEYGIATTDDNVKAIQSADVVVLAIKPQNLADVMAGMKGALNPDQLALSIIAGATIKSIREGLAHSCIVRSMPNTPAQIGEGMTVWTGTAEVTAEQKNTAASILGAMGKEIYVDDEKYLDMATAVSGSGPGYIFLFAEAMEAAGIQIGLSQEQARTMVSQTILGAARLLDTSEKTAGDLRRMVTSPGGTTAAAISTFEAGNLSTLVNDAITAAYKRSQELGK